MKLKERAAKAPISSIIRKFEDKSLEVCTTAVARASAPQIVNIGWSREGRCAN